MAHDRRRFLELSGLTLGALAGCVGAPRAGTGETPTPTPPRTETATATRTPTATATPTQAAEVPRANGAITIEGSEWKLIPAEFTTRKGQQLKVTFKNVGSVAHNLTIGKFPVEKRSAAKQAKKGQFMAKTKTIQPGKTASATMTPDTAGTFPYWCDVSGHRQAGMEGRMIVE